MDLFLVRHGETDENANGIIQGWMDTDLNEHGYQQAKEMAESFNIEVDAIYSSDLKRAAQTAEMLRSKYPDLPYFEDKRLRERNFGDANGTHSDQHDMEVFWASSDTVSIPNAEILNDFTNRVRSFLDSLKESSFSKVLIVTHGGTINRIQYLISNSRERIPHLNASVTHIKLPL